MGKYRVRDRKAEDFRRRALSRPRPCVLRKVTYSQVPGLGSGTLEVAEFLTTIAGGNAAGKSTLLHVVRAATDPQFGELGTFAISRLSGSTIEAFYSMNGQEVHRCVSIDNTGTIHANEQPPNLDVIYIDLARTSREIMEWARDTALEQQLEGLSPRISDEAERKRISRLVRKSYSQIETFELELHDRPLFPYFRVREDWVDSSPYGSESMGQGEMSLHLFDWCLRRIEGSALLLVEEPDAHVAQSSHRALIDAFAWIGASRGCSVIVSTHSSDLVRASVPNGIRILFRQADGVRIIADPHLQAAQHVLHITSAINGMIVCEDVAASLLSQAILRAVSSDVIARIEFVVAGDNAGVIAAAAKTPIAGSWLRLLAVLDGDQRGGDFPNTRWPVTYLPGNKSPEGWLRDIVNQYTDPIAERIGLNSERFGAILAGIDGIDLHDWAIELGASTGQSQSDLYRHAVAIWFDTVDGQAEAHTFTQCVDYGLNAPEIVDRLAERFNRLAHEGDPKELAADIDAVRSLTDLHLKAEDVSTLRSLASQLDARSDAAPPGTSTITRVDA